MSESKVFVIDMQDEIDMFEYSMSKINSDFMEAITCFVEATNDSYITESEKDTFAVAVKRFFADLIENLQRFILSIKEEVGSAIRISTTDSKLHKMYKELVKEKEAGAKTVKVMDVWALERVYMEANTKLSSLAYKYSKNKYNRVHELTDDMATFNKIHDEYEKKLEEISENTITVDINKMINFVEDELTNRSKLFDNIENSIANLKKMEDEMVVIETKYKNLGVDVIPKHISCIKKMSLKISAFIRKWVSKFISKIVFIFA